MKSKAQSRLTAKQIASIPISDSRQRIHIGEGVMLLIESEKKGGGKYFIGKYRLPNKKQPKDYQIGVFGDKKPKLNPEDAINEWHKVRAWCEEENKTPKDYKLKLKNKLIFNLDKPTFKQAVDNFLKVNRNKIKATTFKEYKRKLNQTLRLLDGDTPLEELETFNQGKRVVKGVLEEIASGKKYDLENRCRFLLARVFDLAREDDLMFGGNPVTTKSEYFITADPNQHHPTITWEEVPDFLQALELNACNSHKQIVLATKLLLLTFLRTGALARLEWDWIVEDEKDGKILVIPPNTSGLKRIKGKNDDVPHKVPITPEIDQVLQQAKAYNSWGVSNEETQKYVFLPLRESRFPHLDPSSPNNFLRNLGYKGKFRAHGWRRTALTAGIDVLKTDRDVIKRQMGHLPLGKVNKAYDQSERLEERREFLENWGAKLVEMGLKIS